MTSGTLVNKEIRFVRGMLERVLHFNKSFVRKCLFDLHSRNFIHDVYFPLSFT